MDTALELFATRGYHETAIGDIESGAGLVPRSGGMYRHFRNKEDLLRAAVDRELRTTFAFSSELETVAPETRDPASRPDPRTEIAAALEIVFSRMKPRVRLRRIFARNEPALAGLAAEYVEIAARTQLAGAALFRRIAAQTGSQVDCEALAVMVGAAFSQFVEDQGTPLKGILDVDEERFGAALVDAIVAALGVVSEPARPVPEQAS
jgi:AcrR family transcriptional regulator